LLLFHDVKGVENRLKEGSRTTVATVWQLSSRCLPLGIVTFLVSLNANIPTYVIKNYLDIEQLGVFSAIVYFAIAGQFVTGALAQAAAPRLALYYSRSELGKFKLLQIKLMAIGVGMALVGVLLVTFLGEQLLGLFYGFEYAAHVDVFFWIMISAGIGYAAIFLGTGLTVTRRFREMLFLNVLSVVTTFILSIILVPKYGLTGAGWALAASASLKLIINLMINYMTIYSKQGNPVS
jgi:O-antigen/teichoic acid export membrane protein